MNNQNRIGNTIKLLRKQAGYTQKDLADRIGISDKAVSKWERGLGLPEIGYLRKLSILLDTDTDSLLTGGVQHDVKWQGILVLEHNSHGINAGTIVHDKPLINILLSYFILVGIQEIIIVCPEKDKAFISSTIGDGSRWGLAVTCIGEEWENRSLDPYISANYVMMLYEPCLLYGVDQTRFFQRAMTHKNRLTTLILPQKRNRNGLSIHVDPNMRIINSNTAEPIRKQYDYSILPFLFFPSSMLKTIMDWDHPRDYMANSILHDEVYVEMMDRGFVAIEMDDWNDLQDASSFLRIVQDKCGMNVYCAEEVAWRRGFISIEQLEMLGEQKAGTEYGQYISDICSHVRERIVK